MFHNVGRIDRIIRLILAIILFSLYFADLFQDRWNNAFLAGAILMFFTALRSCCPLYAMLGFGTCRIKTEETEEPRIKTRKLDL